MDKDGTPPTGKAEQIGKTATGQDTRTARRHPCRTCGKPAQEKKETIGDIDILIARWYKRKKIVDQFVQIPGISKVMAKGSTKASVLYGENKTQVDVRLVHPYEFGSALLYLTGSKRTQHQTQDHCARRPGYKINEYGLYEITSGNRVAGDTEESMYDFLGVSYIPPEQTVRQRRNWRAPHPLVQFPSLIPLQQWFEYPSSSLKTPPCTTSLFSSGYCR